MCLQDDDEFDTSYEALIRLSERLGDAKPRGMSAEKLAALRRFKYTEWPMPERPSTSTPLPVASTSATKMDEDLPAFARRGLEKEERCAICLDDYGDDDDCMLGHCGHGFHEDCLTMALKEKGTCPCVLFLPPGPASTADGSPSQCLPSRPHCRPPGSLVTLYSRLFSHDDPLVLFTCSLSSSFAASSSACSLCIDRPRPYGTQHSNPSRTLLVRRASFRFASSSFNLVILRHLPSLASHGSHAPYAESTVFYWHCPTCLLLPRSVVARLSSSSDRSCGEQSARRTRRGWQFGQARGSETKLHRSGRDPGRLNQPAGGVAVVDGVEEVAGGGSPGAARGAREGTECVRCSTLALVVAEVASAVPTSHTFSPLPGFFERPNEIRAVERALGSVPAFTVLFGASSVGKTALLRQVLSSDRFHVLHFDLRIAGFADLASLHSSLSAQLESYFAAIPELMGGKKWGWDDFAREALAFKYESQEVRKRVESGGEVKTSVSRPSPPA